MELLQQAKEVREKRFWTTFQLFICLLSVILVIYFLKDNPVILVSILYTVGILTALRIWSKSQNGKDHRDKKDSSDYQNNLGIITFSRDILPHHTIMSSYPPALRWQSHQPELQAAHPSMYSASS